MKTQIFATVAAAALLAGAALAQEKSVTIASWGGSYQEAQSKALFQPASEATGVVVKEETYGGMSDVRLQVQSGAVTFDIVASGSGSASRAAEEGLLEELDYNVIDVSTFYPTLKMSHCVGGDVFSTVYAWNTETVGEEGPTSWADFWDVEKFPGKRAYRGKVAGALEPALMADGVAPEDVYEVLGSEEGIERAIDKIRELKPHIDVFWSSGAQHAQLMKDGEVDMTTGWNGRFDVAKADGAKVAYSFEQALLDYDCFAIPKGAPNTRILPWNSWPKSPSPNIRRTCRNTSPMGQPTKPPTSLAPSTRQPPRPCLPIPTMLRKQLPVDIEWYAKWETTAAEMYEEMLTE